MGQLAPQMMRKILDQVNKERTLLFFDFDQTFARSMAGQKGDSEGSELDREVQKNLQILNQNFPLAIVSAKTCARLIEKLGFAPRFLIGEHGLEGLPTSEHRRLRLAGVALDWRKQIENAPEGVPSGVFIENKTASLSLHYRESPKQHITRRQLLQKILQLQPVPRVIPGHHVIHLTPAETPSTELLIEELLQLADCDQVLYFGGAAEADLLSAGSEPQIFSLQLGLNKPRQMAKLVAGLGL